MSRGAWGAAFAAWYALNGALALKLLTVAFAEADKARNALDYPTVGEVLAKFSWAPASHLAENLFVVFAAATVLLAGLCWVLCTCFGRLIERFRYDRTYRDTAAAWIWGIRNFLASGAVMLTLLYWGAIAVLANMTGDTVLVLALSIAVTLFAFFYWPIALLNRQLIDSQRLGKWYRVRWPGWSPLCTFAICVLAIVAFRFALGLIGIENPLQVWKVAMTITVGDAIVDWAFCATISLYLHQVGTDAIGKEIRQRATLPFFIAAQLFGLRGFVIGAWVLPPLAVMALSNYFIVPQYQTWMESMGMPLNPVLATYVMASNFVGEYWWFFGIGLMPVQYLITGRFLVLEEQRRPLASA